MSRAITAEEFEELYRSTVRDVLGFVRRRTTGDAEDLVAEAYAIAWRRRGDLPSPVLRRAWLFGIARKLLVADQRRRRREGELVEELASLPGVAALSPDEARARAVSAALSRLPVADQEILRLSVWESLAPAEIAVVLGLRPATARVRLHRARRALAADPQVTALVATSGTPVALPLEGHCS